MIHKIENLVSLGKFRNYQPAGQVNFHKLTLIFGDNGAGKTTLTSVIRSLAKNDPSIIHSRISTNHTTPQAAQIIERGASGDISHAFHVARGWSAPLPNLEIFDTHFVNENVYSGFDFNDGHKTQLHQFAIGAQGTSLKQQMNQNKDDKTAAKAAIQRLEQQLIVNVGNDLTASTITPFLKITTAQSTNIDALIQAAQITLNSANANTVIQTLQPLSVVMPVNSGIDFTELKKDLQSTAQTIQDEVLEELFSSHCKDLEVNKITGAENWLQTGYSYIERKQDSIGSSDLNSIACPFCKQSLESVGDIIGTYAIKFNTQFNLLIKRIQSHLAVLRQFNLPVVIQTINNVNQSNTGRISSWATHLPSTAISPVFNIISDENNLNVQFQDLVKSVEEKLQNPSSPIDILSANLFESALQTINTNIPTYNQSITTYNGAITTFRSNLLSSVTAQLELNRLKRIKKRFDPAMVTICNLLTTERQNLNTLEAAYTRLVQQEQSVATSFLGNYQARINNYLGPVFKTLFKIENVVNIPPQGLGRHSKIGYKLTIDGKDISFAPGLPFSAKECLSEGDKSTIALAFFLSKLDLDTTRQDKILVFDDPLSSLDTNRRAYTVSIIRTLLSQMKQVIVLSHNEYFLHEIGKDIRAVDKKELRITQNFATKSSFIETCDLDELVKNDFFKHIEALEKFRIHPDLAIKDSVLGWLRNVLETHLKFKFYKELRNLGGDKTFGRLIDFFAATPAIVFSDNTNRQAIIVKLRMINSVSWMPHHGIAAPNYTQLGINPNSITTSELDGLIQDTLDLINTQL